MWDNQEGITLHDLEKIMRRLLKAQAHRKGRAMFTAKQKLACIEREIRIRQHVYPNRIETGRMKPDKAKAEIECMEEIAADYRRFIAAERLL